MSYSDALLSSTFLAACLAAGVNAWSIWRTSRERERDRLRNTLAEAYRAYSDYKEFPYAIRRRRADNIADERQRLAGELREMQSRLSYYRVWLMAESCDMGEIYSELLNQLRKVAGDSMRSAWLEDALDSDADMNIGAERVDLHELKSYEDAFMEAIRGRVRVRD